MNKNILSSYNNQNDNYIYIKIIKNKLKSKLLFIIIVYCYFITIESSCKYNLLHLEISFFLVNLWKLLIIIQKNDPFDSIFSGT